MWAILAACAFLTPATVLAALLLWPGAATSTVLVSSGILALGSNLVVVTLFGRAEGRRGATRRTVVRAAAAVLVLSTLVGWAPVLVALALA